MTHQFVKIITALALSSCVLTPAFASPTEFHNGKVIPNFGKVATVDATMAIPKRTKFRVSFDTATGAEPGSVNRTLNSAARFLNMHAEAGIAEKDMKLAVIFHGKGSFDLTKDTSYGTTFDGAKNANDAIIKALTAKGVRIILCGQSAAYHDITNEDLLPGVEMALSAMTAHALLQQEGYTLNPF